MCTTQPQTSVAKCINPTLPLSFCILRFIFPCYFRAISTYTHSEPAARTICPEELRSLPGLVLPLHANLLHLLVRRKLDAICSFHLDTRDTDLLLPLQGARDPPTRPLAATRRCFLRRPFPLRLLAPSSRHVPHSRSCHARRIAQSLLPWPTLASCSAASITRQTKMATKTAAAASTPVCCFSTQILLLRPHSSLRPSLSPSPSLPCPPPLRPLQPLSRPLPCSISRRCLLRLSSVRHLARKSLCGRLPFQKLCPTRRSPRSLPSKRVRLFPSFFFFFSFVRGMCRLQND